MDEKLISSGEAALQKTEALRAAKKQQQAELRRNGQTPAEYVRTDANQGLIEVQDIYGGRALVSSQGSLSNRAIAPGEAVRLYQDERATGWQKVDWKPVNVEQRRIALKAVPTTTVPLRRIVPDEPTPDEPQTPAPPPRTYCAVQCFWYKGTGYKDPAEDEPPEPGQCDVLYSGSWNWEFLVSSGGGYWGQAGDYFNDVRKPIEIELVQPDQPDAFGAVSIYPRARLTYTNADGTPGASPYEGFGFAIPYQNGRRRSIQFCIGALVSTNQGPEPGISSGPSIKTYPVDPTFPRDENDRFTSGCSLSAPPDNCSKPPYGPPPAADPGAWQAICSSNPPISFDIETNSDRSLVTIWDQVTTKALPLAKLDFARGKFSYARRCAEEGPP